MVKVLPAVLAWCLLSVVAASATAQSYQLKAGDVIEVSVWGEEDLYRKVVVLPDGSIGYPLVGTVNVSGMATAEAEEALAEQLQEYLPAPEVSVVVLESAGNRVYVLGKVTQPGSFPLTTPLTAVQALALAGGLDEFADENDILILRDEGNGQTTLEVNYSRIVSGRDLSSNHRLLPGDTILVP